MYYIVDPYFEDKKQYETIKKCGKNSQRPSFGADTKSNLSQNLRKEIQIGLNHFTSHCVVFTT